MARSKQNTAKNGKHSKQSEKQKEKIQSENDVEKIKKHLLKCQGVSATSPVMEAMMKALISLEDSKGKSSNGVSNAETKRVPEDVEIPDARSNKTSMILSGLGVSVRCLLLDIPLMMLFVALLFTLYCEWVGKTYLIPQLDLMVWTDERASNELTYYNRHCEKEDLSANKTEQLIIPSNYSATDCMHHILKHGASIYPRVLSPATSRAARDFILKRNKEEEGFYVIENKFRYSFGIDVNSDPSIQDALHEILNNKRLKKALEKIAGRNPAIIEFTAITSVKGAVDQFYHQDVVPVGSAFKYSRNFLPSYSLFVALQDIDTTMGPTGICPGSHQCSEEAKELCEREGNLHVAPLRQGSAVLLNQQIFHRGTAHRGGPDRVLFILTFAPRPRYGFGQLETRMIGQQGSYSMKWTQWGHTLQDFADAPKKMTEPWKTMRSLGLFAGGNQWGWDFITVASMRIANEDSGFSFEDFEKFVQKGGFDLIPKRLQPNVTATMENIEWNWAEYCMRTMRLCRLELVWYNQIATGAILGFYFVVSSVALLFSLLFGSKQKKKKQQGGTLSFFWLRGICRLFMTHGLVVLFFWCLKYRTETSQWGRNIATGKAFRGYRRPSQASRPGTLPFYQDILKQTRYNSDYLASYNYMLDTTHTGNINWKETTGRYALNYIHLPPSLQRDLSRLILHWIRAQHASRFLTQNEEGNWAEMTEKESLGQVHRDLSAESSRKVSLVLEQLDFLVTETKVGVLRESVLHRHHIPSLLGTLQDKIIGSLNHRPSNDQRFKQSDGLPSSCCFLFCLNKAKTNARKSLPPLDLRRTKFPDIAQVPPPYPGAFLKEGDLVDGKYKGSYNEWYRGKLVRASANYGLVDVKYVDGEMDYGLCRVCVRAFSELSVNELVGIRKDGKFYDGRVTGIDERNGTYSISTSDLGLVEDMPASEIRRYVFRLRKGAKIESKFQGVGDTWYRGKIAKVHEDGSCDVRYDDGDIEFEVEPHNFRFVGGS